MTTPFQRPKLVPPDGHKKVLLHSCCAPCSGEVMEALLASEIDYTIFFYNPNIHPRREYELRKNENIAFAEKKRHPLHRLRLRHRQLVRPRQRHGMGTRTRQTLHHVLRYAL